jgi:hypothetical protein
MPADVWQWRVVYDDGSVLTEAQLGTFTKVDRERCVAIELVKRRSLLGKALRLEIDVAAGQRAFLCRRRQIVVSVAGNAPRRGPTVTVIGWENGTAACYLNVEDDGVMRLTSKG